MDAFVEEICLLHLDCLDDSWVSAINFSEYLEYNDLPSQYEDVIRSLDIPRYFRNLMQLIINWQGDEEEDIADKSWVVLNRKLPYNKLLALLGFFINNGTKKVVKKEHRNKAILASRFYFKLLSIPSYKSYQIYHSQLFVNALACLSFPKAMCEKPDSYSSRELVRQVNSVIKELRDFVVDLKEVIEDLHLTPNDMCFEDVLSNLVDITGGAIVNKLDVDKLELASISRVIYEIIDILLNDANNQPNPAAIRLLFKCILPKLIAACTDSRNANNLVRASYVTYTGLLLSKYGKATINGFMVLLEHLCYTLDGLERSEVRIARVSLVLGLMSLLPQKAHRTMVKWVIQLSTTAKNPHRHVAMEMLAKLLEYNPEETDSNEDTDNASSDETENAVENAENTDNPGNELDPERITDAVAQIGNDGALNEEEVAGLLRTEPHTVPTMKILRAIYNRTEDVSSTLRARALTMLTECVASGRPHLIQAIEKLNASEGVLSLQALGARGVCDERAVVRRAAVALLHRLLERGPQPLPEDLSLLKGLCRDASIIVRSAAIGALSELLEGRPTDVLIDAFLMGPMHQISDPESKVQEQVLTLVQQILIDRLKKYSPIGCDDNLPWMFLAGIIRSNMRRHLHKACSLLAKKNNSVSVRLVDMVSTHLGSGDEDKDLQCLVLLTSAAPVVEYSDLSFVIDYYYKLTGDESVQERDNRLMALTLELLGSWSRFLRTEQRTLLREHLVKRLAQGYDDGCRIATATLAAQLDPMDLQWASQLMQLSEKRALCGGEVAEWLRAADLSLVAETPPAPQLLELFLSALALPLKVPERVAGECVAGVGRLALRSRAAAGRAAPALAALLAHAQPAPPLTPRVNALLVLSDICTRYTCIVEPLLESVCGCLDPTSPPQLRRSAARALTRLFLAGYLRLRTPLYFGFCSLLADDDLEVREPAEYYVTCCLTPEAIYHHFVDCVLYYNKEAADRLSFDARQLIYDVMLQRLSLVQKLNVQCRLAREVLEHAADMVDDGEEIPEALHAALLDSITLLCGPRMRLPKKPEKPGEDIDDLQERVTTNIVSHKMKRTVAEVLVPAVLRLYAKLRSSGGQLTTYLVRIATDLLNDYRPEIEELIENDEEMIARVQHFQETIGQELSFGNSRNLVTTSAPPEPETPRAPKRKASRNNRSPVRKRALRI